MVIYQKDLKIQKGEAEGNIRKESTRWQKLALEHRSRNREPLCSVPSSLSLLKNVWSFYLNSSSWSLERRVLVLYASISQHYLWISKLIYVCSFPTGIVEIQTLSSLFILLKTTFGLKILFAVDGERIYIQLTSAWKRRTLGLCGTFNGNIRDDFL